MACFARVNMSRLSRTCRPVSASGFARAVWFFFHSCAIVLDLSSILFLPVLITAQDVVVVVVVIYQSLPCSGDIFDKKIAEIEDVVHIVVFDTSRIRNILIHLFKTKL